MSANGSDARALLQGALIPTSTASRTLSRGSWTTRAGAAAKERQMAGLVLKNHFFTTALRAQLVASQIPGIAVVGSIVLDQPQGGINPWRWRRPAEAAQRSSGCPRPTPRTSWPTSRPGVRQHPAAMHLPGRHAGGQVSTLTAP